MGGDAPEGVDRSRPGSGPPTESPWAPRWPAARGVEQRVVPALGGPPGPAHPVPAGPPGPPCLLTLLPSVREARQVLRAGLTTGPSSYSCLSTGSRWVCGFSLAPRWGQNPHCGMPLPWGDPRSLEPLQATPRAQSPRCLPPRLLREPTCTRPGRGCSRDTAPVPWASASLAGLPRRARGMRSPMGTRVPGWTPV